VSAPGVMASLAGRELVRFTRQPSRVAASVLTALALWGFLASGLAGSFAPGGEGAANYALFLLPGVATLAVTLSAVFAGMSLIEDRREGFLQSALVSPASRWSIVGGKALGGAAVAAAQGVVIVLAAPLVGEVSPGGLAAACVALALTAVGVTLLGLAAAWWVNSSEGFHGVMNVVLMPMWLLSGAFFPAEGAAGWLRAVMLLNPLRWSTDAIRGSLTGGWGGASVWSWIGAAAFPLVCAALAAVITKGRGAR
jgi:ABC-2 type transport system permease protein